MRITFAVGRIVAGTSHIVVSYRESSLRKDRHQVAAVSHAPTQATVH